VRVRGQKRRDGRLEQGAEQGEGVDEPAQTGDPRVAYLGPAWCRPGW